MDRIRTMSGTSPVYVDNDSPGHCAFEISFYKDGRGRVSGRGHVMGDSAVLGKMAKGQRIEISDEEGHRIRLLTGTWSPGDRTMDVETGPEIIH